MVRDRAEALVRVRDGDHEVAGLSWVPDDGGLERAVGAGPLIGLERERLGRGAGLGRDDAERRRRVQIIQRVSDSYGVGGVEDPDGDDGLSSAEDMAEESRGE